MKLTNLINRTSFLLGCAFAFCQLFTNVATAQQLQPIPATGENEDTSDQIKQIYNLTKAARKIEDHEAIIQRCKQLLVQTLKSKDSDYLESLIVWSKNRIGQKHLQNSISMSETGLTDQAEKELKLATDIFDELISKDPLAWRAWFNRARIHVIEDEPDEAAKKFIEVTRLKRDHKNAWFNAAEICLSLNRNKEAIEFYSRCIKIDPTDIQSLTGRGHAYLASKSFSNAIGDYKTVVKLQPNDVNGMRNLADGYSANGQTELAETTLAQCKQLNQTKVREAKIGTPKSR